MGIGIECMKSAWIGASSSKRCDSCKPSPAAVFCRADSAFLCLNCDYRIHVATRHGRVWMCEVCEQAPASVTCKADAAALCVSCDDDIHSANPLASRHERVPVEPFYDSAETIIKSSHFSHNGGSDDFICTVPDGDLEPGSWLLPQNPNPNPAVVSKFGPDNNNNNNSVCEMKMGGDMFFSEMDPFMDFDYPNQFQNSVATDSVVPVQVQTKLTATVPVINSNENCFDIDFCRNKLSTFSYTNQSLSQSVSSSSLDVGVVPEGNSMSDISYPFAGTNSVLSAGTTTTTNQATPLSGTDREARVMRYREKRKNRKFEKTIRYASRKAYAETRPRIKGRFAKRTKMDSEMDRLYGSMEYGIVPSY
ncbi:zinc finger protein CONSTANS-LIKE 5-like [Rutidosis leptorrhynchoides]|uniref:zinc finger protein CONSTANS-LIKE 5-like n=1 Tax=Rutidosis leptorrhynchoides TaxID=125765 RepID=UPI003A99EAA2